MTRVCHLVDSNLGSRYFASIAAHHDQERFPVMIGSLAPAGPLQEMMVGLGIPTFALGAAGRSAYPAALVRLIRLLKQEDIGVLHAHCFDPTALGLAACRITRTRFVFTRHHLDQHVRLGKRWHVRIDSETGRRADRVIAISRAVEQQLVSVEHVPASRVTVVYNGMEPLPEPASSDVEAVRTELGVGAGPVCLVIARLHEEKGHRFLFEAIPGVASAVGPVTYLLVGEGSHRADLEADVRRRGLEDVVRFLGWRNDVPALIRASSVVALPSVAEPFGFALVEAMSLGVPVVATAAGGPLEIVNDGVDGVLVAPQEPSALAEGLAHVLADPGFASALGTAGRETAKRFSFEQMMTGYEAVYADVCGGATEAARARRRG